MSPTRYHYATLLGLLLLPVPTLSYTPYLLGATYIMFCRTPTPARHSLDPLQKNSQFRKDIRRQQIEERLAVMREEILASLSEDYHLLKNINLTKALESFMSVDEGDLEGSWKQLQSSTSDIFIYSRSDQSDHLYFLFDEPLTRKLTALLEIKKMSLFKKNPRTYIRMLWVMANYVSYCSEAMENLQPILVQLFGQVTGVQDFYSAQNGYLIFTHSQARQMVEIVLYAINNLAMNGEQLLSLCSSGDQKEKGFIQKLMGQLEVLTAFTKENPIKDTLIPSIISKILYIFEQVLKYEGEDAALMEKMYELDFKIANILIDLLTILTKQQKQPLIEYQLLVIIRQFLFTHLGGKPQIITAHNFSILFEMAHWTVQRLSTDNYQLINYSNLLDIQGENKPSLGAFRQRVQHHEKKLGQLLQTFIIIFALNFPQDDNQAFYDLYQVWMERYLIKVMLKLFKPALDNMDQLRHKSLEILRNLCLEEEFCEMIMNQLPILNKLFYYIHSDSVGVRLKKSALGVLNSIICVALQGQSEIRADAIQLLRNNRITEIFARYIGEYVDEELNANLLHSLLLLLSTEAAQSAQEHLLWRNYCCEGGLARLEKYLSDTNKGEIQRLIEAILQAYRY